MALCGFAKKTRSATDIALAGTIDAAKEQLEIAGSFGAGREDNPEVVGSNPSPATMYADLGIATVPGFFRVWDRLVPMDPGELRLVLSSRIQSFLVRFIRASSGRRSNGHVLSGSRRRPVVRS